MDTNNSLLKRAFLIFLPVLLVAFLVSCGFEACAFPSFNICAKFEELPLTTVVLSTPTVGFENPGTIKVIHGSGTATLDHGLYKGRTKSGNSGICQQSDGFS
jgi:hypothetical protein